jgi:hypothetical protein
MIFRVLAERLLAASGYRRRWASISALAVAWAVAGTFGASPAAAANLTQIEYGNPGTSTFLLSGPLTGGEQAKLQVEVAKLPPTRRIAIVLNSPGGLLVEGLRLGRFFHDAKIATYVFAGGIGCHSACSLAFLGGRDSATGKPLRVMMAGARLGFHQFSARFDPARNYTQKDMNAAVEDAHRVMDSIIGYLRAIDEDLSFLTLMLKAPHESIALLSEDAATQRGIQVLRGSAQSLIDPDSTRNNRLASQ